MARLNEPPAAPASSDGAESVEALKRRFIRQNRELAKNNSTQSLRIRSLEIEVSRLLADNLNLRERLLQLENELENARAQTSSRAVRRIKEELQAKIAELSVFVDGMDEQRGRVEQPKATAREKLAAMQGQWRERQPLTELMRDGQMPAIVEDKLYPRQTLGADEIQVIRLSDQSTESPDLGPPPIAHFDYEEPAKQVSPSTGRTSPKSSEDETLPASLTVNLETRRKRRDGQAKLEIRRHSVLALSPTKIDSESSSMLRTGAKRKLADRELERPIRPPSKDDFSFNRRTAANDLKQNADQPLELVSHSTSEDSSTGTIKRPNSPPRPARKVLGDKSVNMSPRKLVNASDKSERDDIEKPAAIKPTASRERISSRSRRASSIPMRSPPHEVIQMVELPAPDSVATVANPKTPMPPDLFSPTPSEPSAKPDERGDTPPPYDLSTFSTSALDGTGRTSRRARAAVNYAEPSLVAKIRRPSKQLVDAVTGLQDPRRAMSVSSENKNASRPITVKKEPENDDAWKDLPSARIIEPGSPLNERSTGDSSDPVLQEQPTGPEPYLADKPSAASSTLSTMISAGRKRRESSQQPVVLDLEAAMKKMEELDMYEFKHSASPGDERKPASAKPNSHRRHSSAPKDLATMDSAVSIDGEGGFDGARVKVGRPERATSRRRSIML